MVDDFIYSTIICIKNDELRLSNIGTFKIIKNERMGRNPKTKNYLIAAEILLDLYPQENYMILMNKLKNISDVSKF